MYVSSDKLTMSQRYNDMQEMCRVGMQSGLDGYSKIKTPVVFSDQCFSSEYLDIFLVLVARLHCIYTEQSVGVK